jgi:hypothetical protein
VNTDLNYFNYIDPFGFQDKGGDLRGMGTGQKSRSEGGQGFVKDSYPTATEHANY